MKVTGSSDPSSWDNKIAAELLERHEVIRDPLHGDIWITALERRIIDTKAFQRLRSIKQLGPTHLVYPGAVHTRFLHSLGTLYCAEQLVEIANRNWSITEQQGLSRVKPAANLVQIEQYPHLLVRLSALLHDVAHIPFGHTLEDEGALVRAEGRVVKQWGDSRRANKWIGPDSEICMAVRDFVGQLDTPEKNSARIAEKIVSDLNVYLTHHGDPMGLEYPYVADLVGNTLCADLLDYLDRDMFFCGVRDRTGDRVLQYMGIVRVLPSTTTKPQNGDFMPTALSKGGKGRAVLLLYRHEREHGASGSLKRVDKFDVLSEAIDLLRRRLVLAEKVHFHRTKIAASAMLISAAGNPALDYANVYEESDEGFLQHLNRLVGDSPRRGNLLGAYNSRSLYAQIYRLNYAEERDEDSQSKKLWSEVHLRYRDPAARGETEKLLERLAGLEPGWIAIYCPDRKMNLKEFQMLVQRQPGTEVKPLERLLDATRKREMEVIEQRFKELWSFRLFVHPSLIEQFGWGSERLHDLNRLCEEVIGLPNDMPELQGKGRSIAYQVADRVVSDYEKAKKQKVPHEKFNELMKLSYREGDPDLPGLIDRLREALDELMRSEEER